jgi:hypothetical protein
MAKDQGCNGRLGENPRERLEKAMQQDVDAKYSYYVIDDQYDGCDHETQDFHQNLFSNLIGT